MSTDDKERATAAETRRLRALEDQVTAFATAVRSHLPPLIGFYPPEARAEIEEAGAMRASMREVFLLASDAVEALEHMREGTCAPAVRLRQWCEENRERCK